MPNSIELRQERARIVEASRTIIDTAEAENRNLDASETEVYTRHETEVTTLNERIARLESQEQREAENAASLEVPAGTTREPGTEGGDDPAAQQRSKAQRSAFMKFLRGGKGALAPEQRALVENTAGEILVPEFLETEIMRSLPDVTVLRSLMDQKSVNRDRVRRRGLGEVAVAWGKLETNQATLADSMPDTPTEEWTYIEDLNGLAKVGEDEFEDTDINLEAYIRDSFARAVGEAEDTAFAIGLGHSFAQPTGFMTNAGGVPAITSTATTYAGATTNAPGVLIDDLLALVYGVPNQYRSKGVFVLPSATELMVRKIKDADGQYIWQPSLQAGRPATLHGYPAYNQEDIDAVATGKTIAAFGDFKAGYRIYDRLGMTLKRLDELYAEDGMIGFKVRFRVGGTVIRPQALRRLKTA